MADGRSVFCHHFSDSEPFLRPAASPTPAAATAAATPSSQVNAGGIVLRRGEAVVGSVRATLWQLLLSGGSPAIVPLPWCLTAGGDGVEEVNVVRGRPPLLSESRPVTASLGAPVG